METTNYSMTGYIGIMEKKMETTTFPAKRRADMVSL